MCVLDGAFQHAERFPVGVQGGQRGREVGVQVLQAATQTHEENKLSRKVWGREVGK